MRNISACEPAGEMTLFRLLISLFLVSPDLVLAIGSLLEGVQRRGS
jgi:hypothetical protein